MDKIAPRILQSHTNETERGELLRHFMQLLNRTRIKAGYKAFTFPRIAHILTGQSVQDLYYLKSVLKDLDDESASKKFYFLIREEKTP